jgi:hypothetical protein
MLGDDDLLSANPNHANWSEQESEDTEDSSEDEDREE